MTIICTAPQATIRSNAAAPCTGGAGSDWMAETNSWGYQAQQRELETGVLSCEAGGSARAFNTKFNHLRPLMLDLPQSGEGVFLLERKSLIATS